VSYFEKAIQASRITVKPGTLLVEAFEHALYLSISPFRADQRSL